MANLKKHVTITGEDFENAPRIGNLVWLQTDGLDKYWDECENILSANQLPTDLFRKTKPKMAFSMACNKMRNASRNADNRVVVRPVKETEHYSRFQISLERVVGGTELVYEKELVAVFDKSTEQITFEGGVGLLGGQIELAIETHFHRFKERAYAGNLLKYANHLINVSWIGIAVRDRGGVWFVPDLFTEELTKLENAFAMFDATLYVHPVLDTEKWRGNVQTMGDDDLEHDLKSLIGDLGEVISEAKKTGEVKAKTLNTRMARFQDVQRKAKAYETLLNYRAEEISEKLETATKQITAILSGKAGVDVSESNSK